MTSQDYMTTKLINAWEQLVITGNAKEKRHSLKRLTEVAQRCRNEELASRAQKIVASN